MSAEPLPGEPVDEPQRVRAPLAPTPVRSVPAPVASAPPAPPAPPATTPFTTPSPRVEPATVPTPRPTVSGTGPAHVSRPVAPPDPVAAPAAASRRRPSPVPRDGREPTGPVRAPSESTEAHAARVVRQTWAEMEPRIDEVAGWFAALLFSLAPTTRALFPAQVTPPARRLLRSMLLGMTTLDRSHELAAALEPLVAEHRALGLSPEHYEALGVALVGAMRRFAGTGWGPDTERAWAQAFSLVAEPMQDALRADTSPAVTEAEVVEHRRLGWDLAIVTVAPHGALTWTPGQYLPVEIPGRPRMWRALSPARTPRADGTMEFHVRAVEGGWVSRAMVAHTRPGDVWRLGPPRGRLATAAGSGRDLLMIAGGTGAAPMLALCEEMAGRAAQQSRTPDPQRRGDREVTVLVGGRTHDDLYALDRFRALADRVPWLAVAGVCEQDPLAVDTIPGRLPEAVVRAGDWSGHEVVVAGSPGMTRATVSALLVEGVGLDRIHYDPFTE